MAMERGIPCIAVLSDGGPSVQELESSWRAFRTWFPARKFCVLQLSTFEKSALMGPTSVWMDPNVVYRRITRDMNDAWNRNDWFDLCDLYSMRVTNDSKAADAQTQPLRVALLLAVPTFWVQASYDFFLQKRLRDNNLVAVDIAMQEDKNWIQPFDRIFDFDPSLEVCHADLYTSCLPYLEYANNIHVAALDSIRQNATFMNGIQPLLDEVKRAHLTKGGGPSDIDERTVLSLLMSRKAYAYGAPLDNPEDFDIQALLGPSDPLIYREQESGRDNNFRRRRQRKVKRVLVNEVVNTTESCANAVAEIGSEILTLGSCLLMGMAPPSNTELIQNAMKKLIQEKKRAKQQVAELWLDQSSILTRNVKFFKTFKIMVDAIGMGDLAQAILSQVSVWEGLAFVAKLVINVAAASGSGGIFNFFVDAALQIEDSPNASQLVEAVQANCAP